MSESTTIEEIGDTTAGITGVVRRGVTCLYCRRVVFWEVGFMSQGYYRAGSVCAECRKHVLGETSDE